MGIEPMTNTIQTEVVIIAYNSAHFIESCIDSVLREGAKALVVDNASSDDTVGIVRAKYPEVTAISPGKNLGYAGAVNLGVQKTKSHVVIISNADVVFSTGAITRLVNFIHEHSDVGLVGPQQVYPDGSWQKSYGDVPGILEGVKKIFGITSLHNWSRRLLWPRKLDRHPKNVGFVSGAVLAVRRQAFDFIGGFDEGFHFYVEDVDFCSRLRKTGWSVMLLPFAEVIHVGGASSTRVDPSDKFRRQWVDSVLFLMKKNVPRWQISFYKRLEKLHAREMLLGCRALKAFSSKDGKALLSSKASMFQQLLAIWSEKCR